MGVKKASNSNLTGARYTDASAGTSKIPDVPDEPILGTPTISYVTASVPFQPSPKGGAPVSYTVVASPGDITATGLSSPIAVTGLVDGTTYTFKVKATNSVGVAGKDSGISQSVTTATYPSQESDSFSRSVSGSLGNSNVSSQTWENIKGTWEADGTNATSSNTPSNNSIAAIFTAGTGITNLQVDTLNTGGVGPAFWISDANSYYAAIVYHSTTSNTTSACNGGCAQSGGYCSTCCSGNYTYNQWCATQKCCDGYGRGFCNTSGAGDSSFEFYCQVSGRGSCGQCCGSWTTIYACTSTTTTTTTNYISNFRLIKNGTAVIDNQYNTNTSAYSSAGSIAISTSGNTISYAVYPNANKAGTALTSGTHTDNAAAKSRFMGIFKGDGGSNQGSSVRNFNVSVS